MTNYPFLVVTIAVGSKYCSWAVTMIETLRSIGQYNGEVHMVTDHPEMFDHLDRVTSTKIDPNLSVMEVKTYKTKFFDLIDKDLVLFLDVDVLIGQLLEPWFRHVKDKLDHYSILVFEDNGMGKMPFHTGVMLMKREAEPLLGMWRKGLESGQYNYDQKAFQEIMPPEKIGIMPKEYLLFPSLKDMESETKKTFVHITFTGRQAVISLENIRKYLLRAFKVKQLPNNCGRESVVSQLLHKILNRMKRLLKADAS